MSDPIVLRKSEPYFLPGNEVGCLMVHGFTACPRELKLMGTTLHRKMGYSVLGIRLPGHGTDPRDMARMRWYDWLAAVEDGYALLKPQVKQLFVIGLSMGGVLSLLFSTRFAVDGVVAMSTPYQIPTSYYPLIKPLVPLLQRVMPLLKKSRDKVWYNPAGLEDRFSYEYNPVRSVYELDQMLEILHAKHEKVTAPLLMIHSEDDDYVPIHQFMHYRNAFPHATFIQISGANHLITQDGDREKVIEHAIEFIEANRNGG